MKITALDGRVELRFLRSLGWPRLSGRDDEYRGPLYVFELAEPNDIVQKTLRFHYFLDELVPLDEEAAAWMTEERLGRDRADSAA